MSKKKNSSGQNKTMGKVVAIHASNDSTDINFELSGKSRKDESRVFHTRSTVLGSLVMAAFARGDKLRVEYLPANAGAPIHVSALRVGAEVKKPKIKTKDMATGNITTAPVTAS